jgi:hypothetical protein
MSEYSPDQDPRAVIYEQAKDQISWIEQGALQIGGKGAAVEDVFSLPPTDRDTAPEPNWDGEQEAAARNLGERLGYAAEKNVPSGLRGGILLDEGGKVWKMQAEAEARADEEDLHSVIISGSPYRLIGEDEKAHKVANFKKQLPEDIPDEEIESQVAEYEKSLEGFTEYDEAVEIAQSLVESVEEEILPYGYEISEGNPIVAEATGQFVKRGKDIAGKDIITMRVDREVVEETGKYQYQPNPLRRMGIISDILEEINNDTETPVIFGTSNAYASRKVDALRAGLDNGRQYGVAMYGRETLARVKDEPMQPGARLNQLPGDIRQMYDKLQKLAAEAQSD